MRLENKNREIKMSAKDFIDYINAASFGHLIPYSISQMMPINNIEKIQNRMDKVLNSK